MKCNYTTIMSMIFVAYLINAIFTFYHMFVPPGCEVESKDCIYPFLTPDKEGLYPLVDLKLYLSKSEKSQGELWYTDETFQLGKEYDKKVNLTLPKGVTNKLFVKCVLTDGDFSVDTSVNLISKMKPTREAFNLMENNNETSKDFSNEVPHIFSVIPLTANSDSPILSEKQFPQELRHLAVLERRDVTKYYPIFFIDDMGLRQKNLLEIKPDREEYEITIDFRPALIGKLRLIVTMGASFKQYKQMGLRDNDLEEIKALFMDTSLFLLGVTFLVTTLHSLFDALAFKNDISFWRKRNSMAGLSSKAVLWSGFSTTVTFLYLCDNKTSLLILVPSGISCLIEYWKITKALKMSFSFSEGIKLGDQSKEEKETDAFQSEAMTYINYLLIPLSIGGAIYNLMYVSHKSWYSWGINSLANCCYTFGFLFMLPQLFVNYKMKSVAHLPWRVFMYKAFNTFVDDLFAFIITMPTSHRIACFRDDIVFFIYLYQRYLYPVDNKRVNEYGMSGDDHASLDQQPTAQPEVDPITNKAKSE